MSPGLTPEEVDHQLRRSYGDLLPGSAYRDGVRAAERRGRSICEVCGVEFTPRRRDSAGRFCSGDCYRLTHRAPWYPEGGYPEGLEGILAEMSDALAHLGAFLEAREAGDE